MAGAASCCCSWLWLPSLARCVGVWLSFVPFRGRNNAKLQPLRTLPAVVRIVCGRPAAQTDPNQHNIDIDALSRHHRHHMVVLDRDRSVVVAQSPIPRYSSSQKIATNKAARQTFALNPPPRPGSPASIPERMLLRSPPPNQEQLVGSSTRFGYLNPHSQHPIAQRILSAKVVSSAMPPGGQVDLSPTKSASGPRYGSTQGSGGGGGIASLPPTASVIVSPTGGLLSSKWPFSGRSGTSASSAASPRLPASQPVVPSGVVGQGYVPPTQLAISGPGTSGRPSSPVGGVGLMPELRMVGQGAGSPLKARTTAAAFKFGEPTTPGGKPPPALVAREAAAGDGGTMGGFNTAPASQSRAAAPANAFGAPARLSALAAIDPFAGVAGGAGGATTFSDPLSALAGGTSYDLAAGTGEPADTGIAPTVRSYITFGGGRFASRQVAAITDVRAREADALRGSTAPSRHREGVASASSPSSPSRRGRASPPPHEPVWMLEPLTEDELGAPIAAASCQITAAQSWASGKSAAAREGMPAKPTRTKKASARTLEKRRAAASAEAWWLWQGRSAVAPDGAGTIRRPPAITGSQSAVMR